MNCNIIIQHKPTKWTLSKLIFIFFNFYFFNFLNTFIIKVIVLKYYLLTPWCRVLLEKLTGLQLVKKFPAFHGTQRFITALTRVRHLSLSWVSPIQSIYPHPTSWRSILIISHIYALVSPGAFFWLLLYNQSVLLPECVPTSLRYSMDVDGAGSNPDGNEIFRPSRLAGPTQPPVQWVPGLSRG